MPSFKKMGQSFYGRRSPWYDTKAALQPASTPFKAGAETFA